MDRLFFILGALSAFTGVAAGAFGAHGLKGHLTPEMQSVFEIAVRYQMYHAFGLIAASWAKQRWSSKHATVAGWLFCIGTILFSGSLYALSMNGVRWFGWITPLGGTAFLAGWLFLAWGARKF